MSPKKERRRVRARPARQSILIVDDEVGTLDLLIAVLEDAGYDTAGASHGREALAKLATTPADLVLLDLVMPVLDGADTLRALKRDARLKNVRVVMMSGIPESMVKRRCSGYSGFLRKPFSLDELLGVVSKQLKRIADA